MAVLDTGDPSGEDTITIITIMAQDLGLDPDQGHGPAALAVAELVDLAVAAQAAA